MSAMSYVRNWNGYKKKYKILPCHLIYNLAMKIILECVKQLENNQSSIKDSN